VAFDWRLYLSLAERLVAGEGEALERTAATRAYYAAFNLCRAWLEERGVSVAGRNVHRRVWSTFAAARHAAPGSVEDWRAVGALGHTLSALRASCDYQPTVADLSRRTGEAVLGARRVVDELLPRLEIA
jgi:hypothetical protein